MRLGNKTIEKLVVMINEETVYRSGPMLVALFNQLGANDRYGQGFPSRATYTRNNIDRLNGTAGIDDCLKKVFSPSEFLEFSQHLRDFRNYIHPRQQLTCHFTPDLNTAKICWHVLKGAVAQIKQRLKVSSTQNAAV